MCTYGCLACMYVCMLYACLVPVGPRRGHRIPGSEVTGSYVMPCGGGIKPGSSGKVANDLNHWFILPSPYLADF